MAMVLAASAALALVAKGNEPRDTTVQAQEFVVTAFKPDLVKRTVSITIVRNMPGGEVPMSISGVYVLREERNYPGFYGDGKIDCTVAVRHPICNGLGTAVIEARLVPLCSIEMAPAGQPLGCAINSSKIEAWVELQWKDSKGALHKLHFHPKPILPKD